MELFIENVYFYVYTELRQPNHIHIRQSTRALYAPPPNPPIETRPKTKCWVTHDFCVELMDAGRQYFVDARRIHERHESETSAHHTNQHIISRA